MVNCSPAGSVRCAAVCCAARLDGGAEHGVEFAGRDHEALTERLDARGQRAVAWHQSIQRLQGLVEVRFVMRGRHRAVERPGLLIEAQPAAAEHVQAREGRARLGNQVVAAQAVQRRGRQRRRLEILDQAIGDALQVARGARILAGVRFPLRRAVIGVDKVGIVLPDGQHEPHVAFGQRAHHIGASHRQASQGHDGKSSNQHPPHDGPTRRPSVRPRTSGRHWGE